MVSGNGPQVRERAVHGEMSGIEIKSGVERRVTCQHRSLGFDKRTIIMEGVKKGGNQVGVDRDSLWCLGDFSLSLTFIQIKSMHSTDVLRLNCPDGLPVRGRLPWKWPNARKQADLTVETGQGRKLQRPDIKAAAG